MAVVNFQNSVDFVNFPNPSFDQNVCIMPFQTYIPGTGGSGPTLTFSNVVYDTVASTWVRWRTVAAIDPVGVSYPGPGAPPGDWKADTFSWEVVVVS